MPRRSIKNWAKHYDNTAVRQRRAATEGAIRPAPSGTPPQTHDQWLEAQAAKVRAREDAQQEDQS
ncbi:hypothetical protein HZZ00_37430 (plasmid) [Streptomyces sp. NEAU-sy36]|uniref:hypothetical protein n=1 Tax=unclassified Streptomyces TaxID=2593676 RepID=UPI0015D5AD74|nr:MULTISPECIES: hypothetical protein [unclassified Streptomyces]QLJ06716.1 hypothetical protein HZZ00_37430 [Streptomyces sp. NEAU-sy36]